CWSASLLMSFPLLSMRVSIFKAMSAATMVVVEKISPAKLAGRSQAIKLFGHFLRGSTDCLHQLRQAVKRRRASQPQLVINGGIPADHSASRNIVGNAGLGGSDHAIANLAVACDSDLAGQNYVLSNLRRAGQTSLGAEQGIFTYPGAMSNLDKMVADARARVNHDVGQQGSVGSNDNVAIDRNVRPDMRVRPDARARVNDGCDMYARCVPRGLVEQFDCARKRKVRIAGTQHRPV